MCVSQEAPAIFLPLAGTKAQADAEDRQLAVVAFVWSHQPAWGPHSLTWPRVRVEQMIDAALGVLILCPTEEV